MFLNFIARRGTLFIAAMAAVMGTISGCDSRDDFGYQGYEIRSNDTVYAYRKSSPYASVLQRCALASTTADSCQLATLPFIGDGTKTPTIEDIMNRVLVTHEWMGARFEAVLRKAPEPLLGMFSSATSILIGSDVRPSFYTRLTGGVELDPVYLWTTVEEKGSISKADDFRSEFGSDLQFWFLSRDARANGDRLAPYYSLDDDSERPVEDIEIPLLRLLFHELAHATDFMPRDKIASAPLDSSVFNAIDTIRDDWLSTRLVALNPLTSQALSDFGQVRFRGLEANDEQKAATATDVGNLMATDGAIHFYSYTSQYEDLAQLVEGVMMAYHYDVNMNIGFSQKPADENNYNCDDLLVAWGQRNRLADPLVNVRSRVATELAVSISPELQSFLDNSLGPAEPMTSQVSWCDNQALDTFTAAATGDGFTRSAPANTGPVSGPGFREMMQADRVVHPDGMEHN